MTPTGLSKSGESQTKPEPMELVFRDYPLVLDSYVCCGQIVPLIITPRIILTLPGPDQAGAMADFYIRNRDHLSPWEPDREKDFFTVQGWKRRLRANLLDAKQEKALKLAVFEKKTAAQNRARNNSTDNSRLLDGKKVVGVCNFNNIIFGCLKAADLGYSIDREMQGRGLMREAVVAGLAWMFKVTGLHRVRAGYIPINHRSARLLHELGFEKEGYMRAFLFINGAWQDHIQTSLINPWEDTADHFDFNFFTTLQDDDIELRLLWRDNPIPAKKWFPAYHFAILDKSTGSQAGTIDLRIGDTPRMRNLVGNIGYSVYSEYRGRSYAAKACELLRAVAASHGIDRLWITCDPDNLPSARVCDKIGAHCAGTFPVPEDDEIRETGSTEKRSYEWNLEVRHG
jgi:ribosomal-protein-alanine N-acetyltransferase